MSHNKMPKQRITPIRHSDENTIRRSEDDIALEMALEESKREEGAGNPEAVETDAPKGNRQPEQLEHAVPVNRLRSGAQANLELQPVAEDALAVIEECKSAVGSILNSVSTKENIQTEALPTGGIQVTSGRNGVAGMTSCTGKAIFKKKTTIQISLVDSHFLLIIHLLVYM